MQSSPPVPDLRAMTAVKPAPDPAILTDAHAAARYDAAVELWGDGVSAAARRVCRWLVDVRAARAEDCGG